MPDAELPEKHRRNEKKACEQWKDDVERRRSPSQKIQQGIILNQRVWNYKSCKQEYFFPVNADRIFAKFSGAVCKDVHKFQPVQRKKAERRIYQKQAEENGRAADEHKKYGQDFGEVPGNIAFYNAVNEHNDGLEDSADAGQLELAAENLYNFALGPDKNAVKFAGAHNAAKAVETACKHFCQRKFHQNNGKAEQNFAVRKSFHAGKTPEHKKDAEKNIKRHHKLPEHCQKERRFILHRGADYDGNVVLI